MSGGDGLHDRQAEAQAVVLPVIAIRGESLEGLEEAVDLPCRDDGPAIGDGKDGVTVLRSGRDLDSPRGHVVAHGVVHEICDEALAESRVPRGRRRVERSIDVELLALQLRDGES